MWFKQIEPIIEKLDVNILNDYKEKKYITNFKVMAILDLIEAILKHFSKRLNITHIEKLYNFVNNADLHAQVVGYSDFKEMFHNTSN